MRIIIIFIILTSSALSEEIFGFPKIIDGDTIRIDNYKLRLEGIDAPEINQKCKIEKLNAFLLLRIDIKDIWRRVIKIKLT